MEPEGFKFDEFLSWRKRWESTSIPPVPTIGKARPSGRGGSHGGRERARGDGDLLAPVCRQV